MMNRRRFTGGLAALAGAIALPAAANATGAAPWPILPALPPHDPALIVKNRVLIARYESVAISDGVPVAWRVGFQNILARRTAFLAFPHADAVARMARLADLFPMIRPNIEEAMAARIAGATGPTDFPFDRVRRGSIHDDTSSSESWNLRDATDAEFEVLYDLSPWQRREIESAYPGKRTGLSILLEARDFESRTLRHAGDAESAQRIRGRIETLDRVAEFHMGGPRPADGDIDAANVIVHIARLKTARQVRENGGRQA